MYRGRFAPSPTGPLHQGSLVAAVASYADALQQSGEWFVRIDNIDPPREDPDAIRLILASLEAHGFFARDNGASEISQRSNALSPPSTSVVLQADRDNHYCKAIDKLTNDGFVFACSCTRKLLASTERYPGTCEKANLSPTNNALRVKLPEGRYDFIDRVYGTISEDVANRLNSIVIRRRDGLWAYQLANVVDDASDTVSDIVRGVDLLDNTARQLALYERLNQPAPRYCHVPVLCDDDDNKLSKQTGAKALDDSIAIQNLQHAWRFLGQSVGQSFGQNVSQSQRATGSISDFWQMAQQLWDPSRIPKQMPVAKL